MLNLKPCGKCPYKLGLIKTLVNPCIQCKANGYKLIDDFLKRIDTNPKSQTDCQKKK